MTIYPKILVCSLCALLVLTACGGKQKTQSTAGAAAPTAAVSAKVGDPDAGAKVYQGSCVACHGADAKGVPSLGKSLYSADSEFIRTKTDAELVHLIEVGRTPDDPLNTTGVGMPAKGGNPAITEQQLYDVVAWMRTLD